MTSPANTPSAPIRHTVDSLTSDALDQLYDRLADYENRITWHTTCGSCARILDASIKETERAEKAEGALTRVQALAERWRYTGDRKEGPLRELLAALDGPAPEPATGEPSLYDKIAGMFSGPLPPPGDQPPATVLPCNHAQLRQPHDPHRWEPQPGMRPVQCPGYAWVSAGAEATEEQSDG